MISDREYFLLKNAEKHKDCKQYYSEYIELESKGLVWWQIGHAWLTAKGSELLDTYEDNNE